MKLFGGLTLTLTLTFNFSISRGAFAPKNQKDRFNNLFLYRLYLSIHEKVFQDFGICLCAKHT